MPASTRFLLGFLHFALFLAPLVLSTPLPESRDSDDCIYKFGYVQVNSPASAPGPTGWFDKGATVPIFFGKPFYNVFYPQRSLAGAAVFRHQICPGDDPKAPFALECYVRAFMPH